MLKRRRWSAIVSYMVFVLAVGISGYYQHGVIFVICAVAVAASLIVYGYSRERRKRPEA